MASDRFTTIPPELAQRLRALHAAGEDAALNDLLERAHHARWPYTDLGAVLEITAQAVQYRVRRATGTTSIDIAIPTRPAGRPRGKPSAGADAMPQTDLEEIARCWTAVRAGLADPETGAQLAALLARAYRDYGVYSPTVAAAIGAQPQELTKWRRRWKAATASRKYREKTQGSFQPGTTGPRPHVRGPTQ